jgi:Holliday junction resolvase RusA-like endonuclease
MIESAFPIPPSVNRLYANSSKGRRITEEGEAYKMAVMQKLMLEGARARCPEGPYVFSLWILVPDRRRRDVSNMIKALEDAVSEYLLYDDSSHYVLHLYKGMDRKNPRAVIRLEQKTLPIPPPPDVPFVLEDFPAWAEDLEKKIRAL